MSNVKHLIDENHKYKKAGKNELDELRRAFLVNCRVHVIFKKEADFFEIGVCDDAIATIIEQVRRRKLYFHIYHDTKGLSEPKEIALYTFWILKLQPFFWRKYGDSRPSYELNARVAMGFFTNGLNFYADKKTENDKLGCRYETKISKDTLTNLKYSFMYRDLSKEAIMDLAESLVGVE